LLRRKRRVKAEDALEGESLRKAARGERKKGNGR